MAKIISVMSSKGGTSKTTLCINLFYYLKQKGFKVLMADTDLQSSSYNFLEEKGENDIAFIEYKEKFEELLSEVGKEYDFIIVDTSPEISPFNQFIIQKSQKILITSKVSKLDIQSIYNLLDLIKATKTEAKSYLLFTQFVNNSLKSKQNIEELKEIFATENLTLINNVMGQSVNYVNSINDLQSIFETKFSKQKIELVEIFSVLLN